MDVCLSIQTISEQEKASALGADTIAYISVCAGRFLAWRELELPFVWFLLWGVNRYW